ncbi:MAG: YhhA family cyclophane-containing RiPP [Flavobacterium sp.]|nr:YhhA family cyclophane-containing RiPP [Flavobacterium sp.]
MEQTISLKNNTLQTSNVSLNSNSLSVEANKIPSMVLKRLIEEVRFENQNNISKYNRTHNRHNRGR